MKLPALLIAIFVAVGVLAASPIAAHLTHGLDLSLGIALSFILAGIVLLKLRQARLAWSASLLAWLFLAAAAAQIERLAVMPDQVTKLAAAGQLELDEPLRCAGFCGLILCGCRGAFVTTSISSKCRRWANGTPCTEV